MITLPPITGYTWSENIQLGGRMLTHTLLQHSCQVGYITVQRYSGHVELKQVEVMRGFRGQRLGSQMLAAVIQQYGSSPIKLEVGSSNKDFRDVELIAWYRRYGFMPSPGPRRTVCYWMTRPATLLHPAADLQPHVGATVHGRNP